MSNYSYSFFGLTIEPNENIEFTVTGVYLIGLSISTYVLTILSVVFGLLILFLKLFIKSNNVSILESARSAILNFPIIGNLLLFIQKIPLVLSIFKPLSDLIYLLDFNYFVNIYFDGVNLLDISNAKVIAIIAGIIAFSYLFVLINEKGILVKDESFTGVQFIFIFIMYFVFLWIVNLVMLIFLIRQLRFIEIFTYLSLLILFSLYSGMMVFTVKSIYNYQTLLSLNTLKISTFDYVAKIITKKVSILQPLFNAFQPMINAVMYKTYRNFISGLSRKILKLILASTIIWAIVAFYISFNMITILFIEAILIVSYYYVTIVKHIPNYKADIYLNDGTCYHNAFITQNFDSMDYIEIITEYTKTNEQIKIFKSSILKIDTRTYMA